MSERNQRESMCPYCRRVFPIRELTADHVPPRGVFGKAGNLNLRLVTVRSCKTCNNSSSDADEAFKGILSFGGGDIHEETSVGAEVSRSLKNRPKWSKQLKANMALFGLRPFIRPDGGVTLVTPSAGWLGGALEWTLLRVVKGLYFHVDPGWDWTLCEFSYRMVYRLEEPDLWNQIETIPILGKPMETGGHFKMSWGLVPEVAGCRVMWQNYYDRTGFFIVAEPRESHERIKLGGTGNLWWINDHFSKKLADGTFVPLPASHETDWQGGA